MRQTQSIPIKSITLDAEQKKQLEEWIIGVENLPHVQVKLSKCCSPLPGDQITGFATETGKVSLHKLDCHNLGKTARGGRKKRVKAYWVDNIGTAVEVIVDAQNRIGLFAEILNAIVSLQTQMKSASAKPLNDDMVECRFTIESRDLAHLQTIIKRVKSIRDVKKVFISSLEKK